MPTPTITQLPEAPLRSDAPATFTTKAEAFVDALVGLPTEINAFGSFLDGLEFAGTTWKSAVRAATTANGTLATAFASGQTIDGIALATGDRILIKDQSAGAENGIYTVNASGAPTRATDFDASAEILGAWTFVIEGTANGGKLWYCTNTSAVTLGTTALTFTQFTGVSGNITASGLTMNTARILGRTAAGTGAIEEIDATQATAFLNTVTSALNGLAPASGGGTVNFLRADGVWAAPAGGGGGGTTTNALTVSSGGAGVAPGGAFDGSVAVTISYNSIGAAPLASPVFTGAPSMPTGTTGVTKTAGDSTTALATTAFVTTANNLKANLASPTFTGTPAAPTAAIGTNTTQIATTAFVAAAKALSVQSVASSATVTPTFSNDAVTITAQAVGLTLANWSGTAANFWGLVVRIKDNGTARAISYGTNYIAADGVTLPVTTVVGKTHELAFVHNTVTSKHVCISAVTV